MNNWYLLAAIPVFGILVLVHEFGHFITAKWAGIRVEEFGLGLPPRIVGIRKRDGKGWEVIWFGAARQNEDSYEVHNQSPLSGPSGGASRIGSPAPASNHTIYSLNWLPIGGFVRMPGENGDLNDEHGKYDPQSFAAKSPGKRFIVLVAGVTMNVILAMVLFTIAFGLGEPQLLPQIGTVVPNSPAAAAGLKPGDTILAVNGQHIKFFADLQNVVDAQLQADHGQHATIPITFEVEHAHSTKPFTTVVNVREHPPAGQGPMGVVASGSLTYDRLPVWQAPVRGVQYTYQTTTDFITAIGQMVTGAVPVQLTGPVGIVKITGQVAQSVPTEGWWPILSLTAVLSLNLAIINILPFPALDGGRVMIVLLEVVRGGKRLKPEVEGMINFVGMALLLTLMVVITYFDVRGLIH
jgi:regulator of sigma E protease